MAAVDLEASVSGSDTIIAGASVAWALASGVTGGSPFSGTLFGADTLSAILTGQSTFVGVEMEIYRPPPKNKPVALPQPVTIRVVPFTPDPPQTSINTRPPVRRPQ